LGLRSLQLALRVVHSQKVKGSRRCAPDATESVWRQVKIPGAASRSLFAPASHRPGRQPLPRERKSTLSSPHAGNAPDHPTPGTSVRPARPSQTLPSKDAVATNPLAAALWSDSNAVPQNLFYLEEPPDRLCLCTSAQLRAIFPKPQMSPPEHRVLSRNYSDVGSASIKK
jgi:hypothetical protein